MYSLVNVDGSATKIELGNLANGYVQEADATVAHLNLFGLNETRWCRSNKGSAVSTDVIALTDDIKINDVKVGSTKLEQLKLKLRQLTNI